MRHSSLTLFLALAVGLAVAMTVPSGPARASDTYAAVAISATSLDTGISWGAASQAQAEQLAVQYCAQQDNNTDCKSMEWARDACVAIAVSNGTGHNDGTWYASGGVTRAIASAQAVTNCDRTKNKDCTVRQAACSNDP